MVNYGNVGQFSVLVRFNPNLRLFVIRVPDSDFSVNNVFINYVVRFLDVFGALPLRLIHPQLSGSLAVQDALGLVRVDEAEVPVVAHHPLLEFFSGAPFLQ